MIHEWVATEWTRKGPDGLLYPAVLIHLVTSRYYKGPRYTVRDGGTCLNVKGDWEYEPLPSSRTATFYARCRFRTFEAAVAALEKAERNDADH